MSDAEDCVVKSLAKGGGDERGRAASEFSDSESIGHVVFFELESLHQLRRRGREKKKVEILCSSSSFSPYATLEK
jgi:hypothetical protein